MAIFVNDTFTDVAGTLLQAHTGETGATWINGGGSDLQIDSTGGRVDSEASNTNGGYTASGTPATAEYDVEADFVRLSADGRAWLTARNSGYAAAYQPGNGTFSWVLWTGPYTTQLAHVAGPTINNGDTVHVLLQIRNAAKKVFVNGTEIISSANNGIMAAGLVGLRIDTLQTSTTGIHIDNFKASDPGGGGASGPPLRSLLGVGLCECMRESLKRRFVSLPGGLWVPCR